MVLTGWGHLKERLGRVAVFCVLEGLLERVCHIMCYHVRKTVIGSVSEDGTRITV